MSTSILRHAPIVCLVLVAWLPACGNEPAEKPAKEYFPQPTEREANLEAALDQRVSISFQNTPLADVVSWFSSKLETPLILDHRSLEDAGVSSDTPVTRKVDGIAARTALQLVLDDLDLASIQHDGLLTVTTQDYAETQLITRVYPVSDLTPLVTVKEYAGGGMAVSAMNVAEETEAGSEESTAAKQIAKPKAKASPKPKAAPDYDSLIEVITTTVRPQTWDEVGGPGSISEMLAAKSIVVSQTCDVHEEILQLLRALRAAKQVDEQVALTKDE
jgi:hypothetical protein